MKYWRGHTALLFHCEWHSESNKVADLLKTLSHLKGRCLHSFPLPMIELVLLCQRRFDFFFQAKVNFFYIRTVGTSAFTPLNVQFSTQTLTPYDQVEKRELIFIINDYYCSLICLEIWFSSVWSFFPLLHAFPKLPKGTGVLSFFQRQKRGIVHENRDWDGEVWGGWPFL